MDIVSIVRECRTFSQAGILYMRLIDGNDISGFQIDGLCPLHVSCCLLVCFHFKIALSDRTH
jgi:hypothetical protein